MGSYFELGRGYHYPGHPHKPHEESLSEALATCPSRQAEEFP